MKFIIAILALSVSVRAQTDSLPATSDRIVSGYISCGCSPSKRGAAPEVIKATRTAQNSVGVLALADIKRGLDRGDLLRKYSGTALNLFRNLTSRYGREATMNADKALRNNGEGVNFCFHDEISGANLELPDVSGGDFNFVPVCSGGSLSDPKYLASNSSGTSPRTDGAGGNSTAATKTGSKCFPTTATIELEGGKRITMSQLRIGDRVRTGPDSFSDVFLFTHRDAEVRAQFVRLVTAAGSKITLTRSHYLYVNGALVSAGSVRNGDVLQLADGSASPISAIEDVSGDGLYNPQTVDGKIVVDGVVSSAYTTSVHPHVAHGALLAPLRLVYERSRIPVAVLDAIASFISRGANVLARAAPSGPTTFAA